MEPLDEARGDDADHALVPALVREHVPAPPLLRLRPLLDAGHRLARDSLLDGLAVAVQPLELAGEPLRLGAILGQQQVEGDARMAEPSRRVDARREPEADAACVHRGRIDAGGGHQRLQPAFCVRASASSPAEASARFSSTSGTTSAIVASATRSRWA